MTIKLPEETFIYKILKFFNKKRDIEIDHNVHDRFGPHVTVKAKKKSFFKTLFGK
jgi:hypothetical protein